MWSSSLTQRQAELTIIHELVQNGAAFYSFRMQMGRGIGISQKIYGFYVRSFCHLPSRSQWHRLINSSRGSPIGVQTVSGPRKVRFSLRKNLAELIKSLFGYEQTDRFRLTKRFGFFSWCNKNSVLTKYFCCINQTTVKSIRKFCLPVSKQGLSWFDQILNSNDFQRSDYHSLAIIFSATIAQCTTVLEIKILIVW